jgi:hypothetical protein
VELDSRFDHLPLDTRCCERMLRLLSSPLMARSQFEALFSAFDSNSDNRVSPGEIEKVFAVLNPHKRLQRVKPVAVPKPQSLLQRALTSVQAAAAPGIEMGVQYWSEHNPFRRHDEEGDEDEGDN